MIKLVSNIKSWFNPIKKRKLSRWEEYDSYKKALEIRIISKAQNDVNNGDITSAINRYLGFFKHDPTNQEIHYEIAKLYIEVGDKKRAGKHLFFKNNLSEEENKCVDIFKKSYGNSPTLILKKLITKENFNITELNLDLKLKLKHLLDEACEENGKTPNFLKGIKRHLDKITTPN